MSPRAKATTGEMLALPLYAVLDLFLDLPWTAVTIVAVTVVATVVLFA